jgi:hypothetical protein
MKQKAGTYTVVCMFVLGTREQVFYHPLRPVEEVSWFLPLTLQDIHEEKHDQLEVRDRSSIVLLSHINLYAVLVWKG